MRILPRLAVTALLSLSANAGCTTETSPTASSVSAPSATSVATGQGLVANPKPVSPQRARALFDAVCGASLPDFATAPARMKANGFTRTSPIGTVTLYSQTENASFQIQDGPGFGKTCSMVVGSRAAPAALRQAVMGEKVMESPLGLATLYPGTKALVLEGSSRTDGANRIANFRMLTERR